MNLSTTSFGRDRGRPGAGTVIPFPQGAARRTRRDDAGAETGRILFFTGVRYERLPEEPAKVRSPRRKRS